MPYTTNTERVIGYIGWPAFALTALALLFSTGNNASLEQKLEDLRERQKQTETMPETLTIPTEYWTYTLSDMDPAPDGKFDVLKRTPRYKKGVGSHAHPEHWVKFGYGQGSHTGTEFVQPSFFDPFEEMLAYVEALKFPEQQPHQQTLP